MPAHKLQPQKLHCPFCSTVSTRGTGLSAHVRGQHAKEYAKWNRNPNRIIEAAVGATPEQELNTKRRIRSVRSLAPVEIVTAAAPPNSQRPTTLPAAGQQTGQSDVLDAMLLLQRAHEQLSTRKQTIESELARIEKLRNEHELVTKQVAALDQALRAFPDSREFTGSDTGKLISNVF